MRYKKEHKEQMRQQMLDAIHRGFRQRGFDGAGVDALAKEAGVTSGAFYTHFKSKAEAFRGVIALGVSQFKGAVEQYQAEHAGNWLARFADFYLGDKRQCKLRDSCALQSLSSDVARADRKTRSLFQKELLDAADVFSAGLPRRDGKPDRDKAWATMATLIGGVTLARAVSDPALAEQIATAVKAAVDNQQTEHPSGD